MSTVTQSPTVSKPILWIGWIISTAIGLLLLMSGVMKLTASAEVAKGIRDLGWHEEQALGLAILEITCAVVYLIPRTAVLGAILLTGYMGGAIATHVRVGDPFFVQACIGVVVWLGLYMRDARLRALVPLRS